MILVYPVSPVPPVIRSHDVTCANSYICISLDFLLTKANHSLNVLDNVANAFSLYNNDPAGELSVINW